MFNSLFNAHRKPSIGNIFIIIIGTTSLHIYLFRTTVEIGINILYLPYIIIYDKYCKNVA